MEDTYRQYDTKHCYGELSVNRDIHIYRGIMRQRSSSLSYVVAQQKDRESVSTYSR